MATASINTTAVDSTATGQRVRPTAPARGGLIETVVMGLWGVVVAVGLLVGCAVDPVDSGPVCPPTGST